MYMPSYMCILNSYLTPTEEHSLTPVSAIDMKN